MELLLFCKLIPDLKKPGGPWARWERPVESQYGVESNSVMSEEGTMMQQASSSEAAHPNDGNPTEWENEILFAI